MILAAEKTLSSGFVMEGSNKHIHTVSKFIGAVSFSYWHSFL